MTRRSHQRAVRYEKDQLGCMWGFISMFDFWHGRRTHGLIQDGRNGNSNAVWGGSSRKKHDVLALDESCRGKLDEEQATNKCKPSVKKLIEEEMSGDKASKKEKRSAGKEMKQYDSGNGDKKHNNCRRKKKGRSKSLDNIYDLDAAGRVGSIDPCHHQLEKRSTNSLDIDILMEEFCGRIYREKIDSLKHCQDGEIHLQADQEIPEFKEKLGEAVKFLVSQQLISENFLTEDGELQSCKEIVQALQILSSDEELFLKLLQDPNSLVVRFVPDFPDAQVKKDEELKPPLGSNFSEQKLVNSTRSGELGYRKKQRFFWRRSGSSERVTLNENKDSQAANQIVILKPGPSIVKNPETESTNTKDNEKIGSQILLAEIKRKLKHAMGKGNHRTYSDGEIPAEHQNDLDGGVAKEYFGMSSPTKEHFYIAKKEKLDRLKDCGTAIEHETADFAKQKVNNIYIEAKKRLSELLNSGHEYIDLSSQRTPKTLGKILALPDYNASPTNSPGRNWDIGFVTAQMRFSGEFQKSNENMQQKHGSTLSPTAETSETPTCISDDGTNNRKENKNTLVESVNDNQVEGTSSPISYNMTVEGTPGTIEETEITVRDRSNSLDTFAEPSSSFIDEENEEIDTKQVLEGTSNSECSKQNSCEEDQHSFSPSASPPNSLVSKKVGYAETFTDVQKQPSPVSVLEPMFIEDNASPASTRSHAAETSLKPIKVQFEECGSSIENESHHTKRGIDDQEIVLEYVKAVLEASSLNWDKLCVESFSLDQLLDPSLLDEVELPINQLCTDQKLLFDCINEVLMELCVHYFGCSPWVSFVNLNIRPIPNVKSYCQEVWGGVYWHLVPITLSCTLDQIVRKDMGKTGTWLDLRLDTYCIGTDIGDAILEDLMEDSMVCYTDASQEDEFSLILNRVTENQSSIHTDANPEDDGKENVGIVSL